MGTVVTLRGKRGVSYKAVVRRRGVTRTKTFKRIGLARRWITATEAAIESGDDGSRGHNGRGNLEGKTLQVESTARKPPVLPIDQRPWYTLEEACSLLGLKESTGRNMVHLERFPVPHEKIGRRNVVLKDVMAAYFDVMRERGLEALRDQSTTKRRQ